MNMEMDWIWLVFLIGIVDAACCYLLACVLWFTDCIRGEEITLKDVVKNFFWDSKHCSYSTAQGIILIIWSPIYLVMATFFLIYNCILKIFKDVKEKIHE